MSRMRQLAGRPFLHSIVVLFCICSIVACSTDNKPAAKPTPTTLNKELVALDLGIPTKALQAPITGNVPDDTVLKTVVTFKINQQLLDQLDKGQEKDGEQVDITKQANELGITDEQFKAIKDYFGVSAISLELNKLHTSMKLDIKAGSAAKLLQTKFVYHELAGRKYYTPATPIMLPKFIVDHIEAVSGLEDYSRDPQSSMHNNPLRPLNAAQKQQVNATCLTQPNNETVMPQHVSQAYGFDQFYKQNWTGKGMTIILPEFEAYDPVDVQNYFECVGFRGKLTTINVDREPTEIGGEATLDIQMVAGLAPDANIVVYQAEQQRGKGWQTFHSVFNRIIEDYSGKKNAPAVVSLSWGAAEAYLSTSTLKTIASDITLMTKTTHMTVFVASGDCGAFDTEEYPTELTVDFPASSSLAVGVGGTRITLDNNGAPVNENVWSDKPTGAACENSWGSGGGLSRFFAQPKWQNANGVQNKYSDGKRQVPDVAAVADKLPIFYKGDWVYSGGTSAATPIWATAHSLVNQGLIKTTGYYIYGPGPLYTAARSNASSFGDIREGDNLYYPATTGWDYTTGLGSPDLPGLYQTYQNLLKKSK